MVDEVAKYKLETIIYKYYIFIYNTLSFRF